MNSWGQSQPLSTGQSQHSSTQLASTPRPPDHRPRLVRVRKWLRSRTGRVVVPVVALALGVGIGVLALLLYAFSIGIEGKVLATPLPSPGGDIVVQVSPSYISRLLETDLRNSGLPGNIENVRVTLADSDRVHSSQITVNADDQISMLGIGTTRHFTIVVQPFIEDCQLKVHVLHATLSGIPVTRFVSVFEGQVDQQLQMKPGGLPGGFTYCLTDVRTRPQALFLTYTATPE